MSFENPEKDPRKIEASWEDADGILANRKIALEKFGYNTNVKIANFRQFLEKSGLESKLYRKTFLFHALIGSGFERNDKTLELFDFAGDYSIKAFSEELEKDCGNDFFSRIDKKERTS